MPSGAQPQVPTAGASASTEAKVRRASMDVTKSDVINTGPPPNFSTQNGLPPQPSGPPQQPAQPPLQAQRMYPHHPLLAGTPPTMTVPMGSWPSSPPTNMMGMSMPNFSAQYVPSPNMMPQTIGPNGYVTFQPPFTAMPMRMSGSDQGNSMMGRAGSMGTTGGLSNMGYEFGFKKRACDQCNHSKVRCDFAEPCRKLSILFVASLTWQIDAPIVTCDVLITSLKSRARFPRSRISVCRCPCRPTILVRRTQHPLNLNILLRTPRPRP